MARQPAPLKQTEINAIYAAAAEWSRWIASAKRWSAEATASQQQAKAEQEAAKVQGVHLDNALKLKKLREPTQQPQRPEFGRPAGR